MSDWHEAFDPAPLPRWLDAFDRDAAKAVDALLRRRFYHGHLQAAEPEDLLVDWAAILDDTFVQRLDAALASWVEANWGKRPQGESAARVAGSWMILANTVAALEDMTKAAAALRGRFDDAAEFLGPLSVGPSRDPLGRYLGAVAAHQTDRKRAPFWWRLCDLSDGQPFYRARWAVEGLRGLPAPDDENDSGFRPEAVQGVARLANALRRLTEEGKLSANWAEETFLAVGRLNLVRLPFPKRWREVLSRELGRQSDGGKWLVKLVPDLRKGTQKPSEPFWADRVNQIAEHLKRGGTAALEGAELLLDEQRRNASARGDSQYLVRSLCRFGSLVWHHHPDRAVRWAEESVDWEPWNVFSWKTLAKALQLADRLADALEVAWQAVERFPEDAQARNTLADTLLRAHHLDEAEAVYRETVELFPDNPVARNGLAEVLKAQRRFRDAEAVYRETVGLFPDDPVARNGLAEVLKADGRLDESREIYRETVDRFPRNDFARTGLRTVERLLANPDVDEPETPERPAPAPLPVGLASRTGEARALRRRARQADDAGDLRRRARALLDEVLDARPSDPRALTEKALLEIESGHLDAARQLLEGELDHLPGAVNLLAALARAERQAAEDEALRLDDETIARVLDAPHRLRALDRLYDPLVHLQEGRAYLALNDGNVRCEHASTSFDRLRQWIRGQEKEGEGFAPWWAGQVAEHALGPVAEKEAVEANDVDGLDAWQREHAAVLDLVEEEFSNRQHAVRLEARLPGS